MAEKAAGIQKSSKNHANRRSFSANKKNDKKDLNMLLFTQVSDYITVANNKLTSFIYEHIWCYMLRELPAKWVE